MSSFEPNKRHLRELLIYFFNLKKSTAEAHRLLLEKYGEAALSERSCHEWFQKFKNGEFDSEDKERSGRPTVYMEKLSRLKFKLLSKSLGYRVLKDEVAENYSNFH